MSRFKEYISPDHTDDEYKTFRSLMIKIVDEKTNYNDVIEKLSKRTGYSLNETKDIVKKINRELQKHYKTKKYRFDLCVKEGISPEELEIKNSKSKQSLIRKWHNFNAKLSEIKLQFDKELKNKK